MLINVLVLSFIIKGLGLLLNTGRKEGMRRKDTVFSFLTEEINTTPESQHCGNETTSSSERVTDVGSLQDQRTEFASEASFEFELRPTVRHVNKMNQKTQQNKQNERCNSKSENP